MTVESQILATQAASLEGYWACDEASGTTLADSSGNGNDLTLSGTSGVDYDLAQTGADGNNAIEFHGAAGYASRTDSILGSTPAAWTLFAFVKTAGSTAARIVSLSRSTDDIPMINLIAGATGARSFVRNDASTPQYSTSEAGTLTDNNWHSVALRWDGTTHSLVVDGVQVDSSTAGLGTTTLNRTSIGALIRTTTSNYFDGLIQYAAIWSTALTTSELSDIHSEAGGAASIAISSPSGVNCYQRDGSDEHSLTVSGTYSGTVTSVEYRWDSGSWATLDASPSGGTYSGTATLTAGQGALDVRFANSTGVTASTSTLTVGDVYVIAGQSNAEGRGTNAQSHTGNYTLAVYREDDAWRLNDSDPVDTGTASGSCWPLLSTLLEASESVPIIFITTSTGATGLVSPDDDWAKGGGGRYENMTSQITSSGVNSVKAVLWHQGEKEATNGISQATVNAALDTLAANMAADIAGAPPLVIAQIGMHSISGALPYVNGVRLAESDAWDDNAGIYEGPITYDMDLSGGDDVHFKTDAHLQLLADRWWVALQNGLYDRQYGYAPRIIAAVATATDEITVAFDRALQTGSLSTAPWSVGGSGSPPSVSSVAIGTQRNHVVLSLSGALTASPTLELGYGNTAGGVDLPRSTELDVGGRVIHIPARPFSVSVSSADETSETQMLMGVWL